MHNATTEDSPMLGGVHLGDTAAEMPSRELAVALVTAQYKAAMLTRLSFSSLSGVSGSSTGRDRACQASVKSPTSDCRLKETQAQIKHHPSRPYYISDMHLS